MNALLHIGLSNALICGAMAVLLLPVARLLRRPAVTHALCVLILLKLVTPPLFNVPVIWSSTTPPAPGQQALVAQQLISTPRIDPPAQAADGSLAPVDEAAAWATSELQLGSRMMPARSAAQSSHPVLTRLGKAAAAHWRVWLLGAWAASAALMGALTLGRMIRLRRIVRRATVPRPGVGDQLELLCNRLGIRRVPGVRFILGSPPPMLLALFCRAELVIPIDLWERLDGRQRQTLLLHELAHLRRRDHWVRYLELLATCLYWWHFATWLARRALHEAEEHCCDAWVVWAMPESSRTYMTTLLDAVEFLSRPAQPRLVAAGVLGSGMGQFHNLQRRLTMVRERNTQRRLGARGMAAVALLSAIALPLGARIASGDDQGTAKAGVAQDVGADIAVAHSNLLAAAEPQSSEGAAGLPPAIDRQDPLGSQSEQSNDRVAKLEAELAAARRNVERLQRQLEIANRQSPRHTARVREARLGQIIFRYHNTGSSGAVMAFDGPTNRLLWKLDVPMNSDSGIRCYDNDTLLIRSADGYSRLVGAWDGKVIRIWAPGVEAPAIDDGHQVNPFGSSSAPARGGSSSSSSAPAASPSKAQDSEQRMRRMEENIRRLTEAVERLSRQQGRPDGDAGKN